MSGIAVSCRGVVYLYRLPDYDVVALAGVDLDIQANESVALLGPSGSGKSTLLAVIAGLLTPSAGRLLIGGEDVTRADVAELARLRATRIGVVLQGAARNLLPYLSVEQNVRFAQRATRAWFGRQLVGAKHSIDLPAPREVLGLVGLAGRQRGRMRPGELTPGERQRLALAVALANRPGLLLADEPTSQLDRRARDEVLAALGSVCDTGTTVVVVTHDPEVSARMGRTVTIRDGRVGAEGRRGEDFAVVGRDGSIQLPVDVAEAFPPGTLVQVRLEPDGSARVQPATESKGPKHAAPGIAAPAGRAGLPAEPQPVPLRQPMLVRQPAGWPGPVPAPPDAHRAPLPQRHPLLAEPAALPAGPQPAAAEADPEAPFSEYSPDGRDEGRAGGWSTTDPWR